MPDKHCEGRARSCQACLLALSGACCRPQVLAARGHRSILELPRACKLLDLETLIYQARCCLRAQPWP